MIDHRQHDLPLAEDDDTVGFREGEALCPICHLTSHARLPGCPICKEDA